MDNNAIATPLCIGTLVLANRIMPASGTFSWRMMQLMREAYPDFLPGAVVPKSLSADPWPGNPQPRTIETPFGMINCIGIQNLGKEEWCKTELPRWRGFKVPVIANVSGKKPAEFVAVIDRLEEEPDVAAIEANLSCPNLWEEEKPVIISTRPDLVALYVRAIRPRTKRPVIVKLTPNVTNIGENAHVAQEEGADAISAVNTFLAMAYDPVSGQFVRGGYSGPAIKAMALRKVEEVCNAVRIPVIGMGGIATAADAREFIGVGAAAIAVGTANFSDPTAMAEIYYGVREDM